MPACVATLGLRSVTSDSSESEEVLAFSIAITAFGAAVVPGSVAWFMLRMAAELQLGSLAVLSVSSHLTLGSVRVLAALVV